jgi:flagellar biosynthesis protein FlhG
MLQSRSQRVVDQAEALRGLARAERRATTIAITSGKGGVGKTNLAVNLGLALADRGLSVTLLDLDLGLANADLLLNLRTRRHLGHVVSGSARLEDIVQDGPAGLRLVPGASGLERLADLSEFERHKLLHDLQSLENDCDVMLMDLGAGVSRNVLAFASAADTTLVVATPEPTAIADAYATIKLLSRKHPVTDIELIVNQVNSRKEARATYERLAGVASKFLSLPVTYAGYVLCDDIVPEAVRLKRPFLLHSPRSNASACIRAVAKHYARHRRPTAHKRGFFRKVAEIFQ